MITFTPVYAGIFALMFVVLSFRVIGRRRTARVSLGDGGDDGLIRRVRIHGNFAEYVPFTLLLMLLIEIQGQPVWLVHFIGIALLLGRLAHAAGVGSDPQNFKLRAIGMISTMAALITGAAVNLGVSGIAALVGSAT